MDITLVVLVFFHLRGDALAHVSVSDDVAIVGVVHHSEIAAAKRFSDGHWDLRLGFDELGAHLLSASGHLLLSCDSGSTADLGFCLGNLFVGFGLTRLQGRTDVFADVDVSNINREDLELGICIETTFENTVRDVIRILEHVLVALFGTDR